MLHDGESSGLSADRPGPPGTLLFENEQVRVWELILAPGESCLWHVHPYDHLLIVHEGATLRGLQAGGEQVTFDFGDNETFYVPRSDRPEVVQNVSTDRTLRELIVDLKNLDVEPGAIETFRFFGGRGQPQTIASWDELTR